MTGTRFFKVVFVLCHGYPGGGTRFWKRPYVRPKIRSLKSDPYSAGKIWLKIDPYSAIFRNFLPFSGQNLLKFLKFYLKIWYFLKFYTLTVHFFPLAHKPTLTVHFLKSKKPTLKGRTSGRSLTCSAPPGMDIIILYETWKDIFFTIGYQTLRFYESVFS